MRTKARVGIAILKTDKIDFKTKAATRDKDNDKGIDPTSGYKTLKHLCTQH